MPASGSTITDWAQIGTYSDRLLLVDDDFSWSELAPRRRRAADLGGRDSSARAPRRWRDLEGAGAKLSGRLWPDQADARSALRPSAPAGDAASRERVAAPERVARVAAPDRVARVAAPDRVAESNLVAAPDLVAPLESRRTVLITGHGDQRYALVRRRRERARLPLHERPGFSPDRTAMWAVLLCLALLLGCVAH